VSQLVKEGKAALVVLLLIVAVTLPRAAFGASSSRQAVSLSVAVIPPLLPVGTATYPALVISLLDGSDVPTLSLSNLTVFLSSSNESVARVPSEATFLAGHSFLQVGLSTTNEQGFATVTAASAGLVASSVTVKTVRTVSRATGLALYLSPMKGVNGLVGNDVAYAIQLVDSAGNPATNASMVNVVMVSSNKTILSGSIVVPMAAGTDLALGVLPLNASGVATITALAPQLKTATAQLNLAPTLATVTVTFNPPSIVNGNDSSVTVTVQVLGMPVKGANVTLGTSVGEIIPTSLVTGASGQVTARYDSSGLGPATVTATARSGLLGTVAGSGTIVVTSQTTSASAPSQLSGVSLYVPLVVIAVVVLASVLWVRRALNRRTISSEEDYLREESSGA
jgi:hypothetical protein